MYVYIYVYIYIHVCIYLYVYIYIHIHITNFRPNFGWFRVEFWVYHITTFVVSFEISRPGSSWTKWLQLEESRMSSHITHWPRWAEPSAVIFTLYRTARVCGNDLLRFHTTFKCSRLKPEVKPHRIKSVSMRVLLPSQGYAKAGRMDTCFELYELMRSRGLSPSQVTYGILLDGFINDNEA